VGAGLSANGSLEANLNANGADVNNQNSIDRINNLVLSLQVSNLQQNRDRGLKDLRPIAHGMLVNEMLGGLGSVWRSGGFDTVGGGNQPSTSVYPLVGASIGTPGQDIPGGMVAVGGLSGGGLGLGVGNPLELGTANLSNLSLRNSVGGVGGDGNGIWLGNQRFFGGYEGSGGWGSTMEYPLVGSALWPAGQGISIGRAQLVGGGQGMVGGVSGSGLGDRGGGGGGVSGQGLGVIRGGEIGGGVVLEPPLSGEAQVFSYG
jgi:hypothetical protein